MSSFIAVVVSLWCLVGIALALAFVGLALDWVDSKVMKPLNEEVSSMAVPIGIVVTLLIVATSIIFDKLRHPHQSTLAPQNIGLMAAGLCAFIGVVIGIMLIGTGLVFYGRCVKASWHRFVKNKGRDLMLDDVRREAHLDEHQDGIHFDDRLRTDSHNPH